MFMVQKNTAQKERLDKIYRRVRAIYGELPPQMEFLGNIDADYLEDFLKSVLRLMKHPNIKLDIFAFIRLNIADMPIVKCLIASCYSQKAIRKRCLIRQ